MPDAVLIAAIPSLPRRQRLHLYPTYPWRRSPDVRTSLGALEPRAERREGAP